MGPTRKSMPVMRKMASARLLPSQISKCHREALSNRRWARLVEAALRALPHVEANIPLSTSANGAGGSCNDVEVVKTSESKVHPSQSVLHESVLHELANVPAPVPTGSCISDQVTFVEKANTGTWCAKNA